MNTQIKHKKIKGKNINNTQFKIGLENGIWNVEYNQNLVKKLGLTNSFFDVLCKKIGEIVNVEKITDSNIVEVNLEKVDFVQNGDEVGVTQELKIKTHLIDTTTEQKKEVANLVAESLLEVV